MHKFIISRWKQMNGVMTADEFVCQNCLIRIKGSDEINQESNQRCNSQGVRDKSDTRSGGKRKDTP